MKINTLEKTGLKRFFRGLKRLFIGMKLHFIVVTLLCKSKRSKTN